MGNNIVANMNILIRKDSSLLTRESILMEHIYLMNDFLVDKIEIKLTNCNGEVVYIDGADWNIEVLDVLNEDDEPVK